MKKILVTGGGGFIGCHLSKHLANEGNEVMIVDNLFRGRMDDELKEILKMENVKYTEADLTNSKSFEKLDSDFDYVYHLAAINGTRYFYEIPDEVLRTNSLATINILDWFVKSECKKILFSSSSEVYAGAMRKFGLPIPTPEDVPLCIEDVQNSRWSYAGSKIIGELLFINYAKKHDFDMTIVRYHNIYGPRMGYEHVIPEFLLNIYKNIDPFPVYGNTSRAFCYIDDATEATELVMKNKNCNGEVLNIGNDLEEISMVDLAKTMFDVLGYGATIDVKSAPEGSVDRRCPNINKLKKLTGYKPKINLKKGIELTHRYCYKYFKERNKEDG
ncbi:MAG: NAD-dependent epimerase/dehydratase family protein [Methanocellales archaeon]|nr:NAD-dependent epimerase/dehydratase family protein [Methanocellales archaeon]MDD4897832.1 NAD-dependent epimerase/dehydratase family protein [Methanocellales archaeon]MDD5446387.1 NAD-dependent epimerase/dehydratase family protein [Methanocellales archaeon]